MRSLSKNGTMMHLSHGRENDMLDRLIATISLVAFMACLVWLAEAQSVQQAFWAFTCLVLAGVAVFSFLDDDDSGKDVS